jgi:NADH dehydrogenase/NADH:ubiquinone oxidoreductase subunit G
MSTEKEAGVAENVELTIDGRPVSVAPGTSLLAAAEAVGVTIPVLCYFAHTTANGLCRLCVVEVEGARGLVPACVTQVRQGAVVHSASDNVLRARRTILEMLAASVDLSEAPEVLRLMQQLGANPERFSDARTRRPPVIDDNPVYIRDYAKCVLCWRCVQVCADDAQYAFAINFGGRGFSTSIATFFDRSMPETSCVFCGQCVGVCPTGALKGKREYLLEQGMPADQIFAETRLRGRGQASRGGPRLGEDG